MDAATFFHVALGLRCRPPRKSPFTSARCRHHEGPLPLPAGSHAPDGTVGPGAARGRDEGGVYYVRFRDMDIHRAQSGGEKPIRRTHLEVSEAFLFFSFFI